MAGLFEQANSGTLCGFYLPFHIGDLDVLTASHSSGWTENQRFRYSRTKWYANHSQYLWPEENIYLLFFLTSARNSGHFQCGEKLIWAIWFG